MTQSIGLNSFLTIRLGKGWEGKGRKGRGWERKGRKGNDTSNKTNKVSWFNYYEMCSKQDFDHYKTSFIGTKLVLQSTN